MFWTDLVVTNLVWQCMFIIWSILWKGYFAVFKVKVTVKVRNFIECLSGQYLWSIKVSMVMHHHEPEYNTEIYLAIFKVKATIVSTRSSAILKLFQSKWVFWYNVTRRCKTPWTDFIVLLRARDRGYGLGDYGSDCCYSWPAWCMSSRGQYRSLCKEYCLCNE